MQRHAGLLVGAMLVLTAALFLPPAVFAQMPPFSKERQPYEDEVCVLLPEIDGEPTRLVGLSLHVAGKDVALPPGAAGRMVSFQCPPTATEEIAELEQTRAELEAHIMTLEAVQAVLEEEIAALEATRQEYIAACTAVEAACAVACAETRACIELCDCVGDGCDCGCGIPNCNCPTCVVW